MTNRCTGQCCLGFTVMGDGENTWSRADVLWWQEHGPAVYDPPTAPATQAIIDMLVPLDEDVDGVTLFICKNHDPETGDCRIYADRPPMCVKYGGPEQPCKREGCTLLCTDPPTCTGPARSAPNP